jgi:hypothetical protein
MACPDLWDYASSMVTATAIATTLMLSPTDSNGSTQIDHVIVEQSSDAAHVLAYNSDGQVVGEIILSHETGTSETAELHLDAIFPDGAYMFAVVTDDGEQKVEIQGNAAAQIAEIQAILVDVDGTKAKWWKCAGEIGLATAAFIAVHPVTALATTVLAACECLPLLVDDFAGMECFSGSGE